ncbi:MAG: hypothetical protein KBD01_01145 [Acidobacteria bacterium]|nr:hypothetical protein [Acidobacteriota bacterium]
MAMKARFLLLLCYGLLTTVEPAGAGNGAAAAECEAELLDELRAMLSAMQRDPAQYDFVVLPSKHEGAPESLVGIRCEPKDANSQLPVLEFSGDRSTSRPCRVGLRRGAIWSIDTTAAIADWQREMLRQVHARCRAVFREQITRLSTNRPEVTRAAAVAALEDAASTFDLERLSVFVTETMGDAYHVYVNMTPKGLLSLPAGDGSDHRIMIIGAGCDATVEKASLKVVASVPGSAH